ncbi:unnamed protein product [Caenorhabditis sp. 36 PRJEB53466]|nr:unnamed protein product [Caenorhabditis sp. 36 PRJEB53466]
MRSLPRSSDVSENFGYFDPWYDDSPNLLLKKSTRISRNDMKDEAARSEKAKALEEVSQTMLSIFSRHIDTLTTRTEQFKESLIELATEHKKRKAELLAKKIV